MLGKTHLLAGLLLSFFVIDFVDNPLLALIIILLGSLLPDIDEKKSFLGRKTPLIGVLFKHRGVFHSLLFCAFMMVLLSFFIKKTYVWLFALAFLLHLLLDGLTPAGVRPFWPSKLRMRGFVRVGGVLEELIFWICIGLFVYLIIL